MLTEQNHTQRIFISLRDNDKANIFTSLKLFSGSSETLAHRLSLTLL